MKEDGNGCLEMAYHGEVKSRQKEENEASDQLRERETKILRSREHLSEESSADKETELEGISETSREHESIKEVEEKDEKLKESVPEENVGKPDRLVEGIVSKDDEEDEDIMREIEEQLKDISVTKI